MDRIEQLIEDTLHERRITSTPGTCFVANEAGLELLHCESNVCGELEKAIREIDDVLRKDSASVGQFPGLAYVIGGYLVNAARHDSERAIEFMKTLSPVLLRKFIANVPVFFRKMKSGYNFDVAPPKEYVDFVKHETDSKSSTIAETAQRALLPMSKQKRSSGKKRGRET